MTTSIFYTMKNQDGRTPTVDPEGINLAMGPPILFGDIDFGQ